MKIQLFAILLIIPFFIFGQKTLSMSDAEGRREVSMNDATGKTTVGVYRYYAQGESQPFTGILYSQYPNGNFESWQEYSEGVGQGKWINYYENGNYKEIGNYEQNRVEGPIKKFYPSGKLKAEGTYKNWRIKVGEWKYYNEAGELELTEDYGEKGNIEEVKEYYERGDISYQWYSQILSKNGF